MAFRQLLAFRQSFHGSLPPIVPGRRCQRVLFFPFMILYYPHISPSAFRRRYHWDMLALFRFGVFDLHLITWLLFSSCKYA